MSKEGPIGVSCEVVICGSTVIGPRFGAESVHGHLLEVIQVDDVFEGWFLVCHISRIGSFLWLLFLFVPLLCDGAGIQIANDIVVELLDQGWRVSAIVRFGRIPTGKLVDN